MAAQNIIVQVIGGQKKVMESGDNVADARTYLGLSAAYKASLNGEPVNDSTKLRSGDYVSFSEAVKGA